eukprot:6436593-Prymnesium_polylepis.1
MSTPPLVRSGLYTTDRSSAAPLSTVSLRASSAQLATQPPQTIKCCSGGCELVRGGCERRRAVPKP